VRNFKKRRVAFSGRRGQGTESTAWKGHPLSSKRKDARRDKKATTYDTYAQQGISNVNPERLLFAKTHEWVNLSHEGGSRIATVGISDFAVQQLTDLVYIELPKTGRTVIAGESFGEIESVKAVSDLYSPVTGEIVDVNSKLANSLETFSTDPYGEGWIIKVRVTDESSLAGLLDYEAYRKQCSEEG
jgi:glycine cleavage system H protein